MSSRNIFARSGTHFVRSFSATACASVVFPVDSGPMMLTRLTKAGRTHRGMCCQWPSGSARMSVAVTGTTVRP
ncbi:Uncharacterised protein [Mycobacterium tuberculosis]|uniref:Uncharacterized protein n=1 Tax=Mycobacterium tuberculosis TaxID=1773 RepID=A0A916PCH2_MYCTX|nr:Uncharacterised protein [Mycobacterium tuberculosis]COZ59038.1 Uncharacterised protein [Mycobacterium tuberculosis]